MIASGQFWQGLAVTAEKMFSQKGTRQPEATLAG
jgi:hypothetical protein